MKQINWSDHILNFVAVILGVTLAFYVSDSADRQREKDELQKITKSFIDELQEDLDTYLEYQIPDNEAQSTLIADILYRISQKKSDSLADKIQQSLNLNSYSPGEVTFNSIVSSGKLDLITGFELRKDILTYYQFLAKESQARGQLQIDFYMDQILPWIVEETDIMNPEVKELVNNRKLANILILYKSLIDNKIRHYKYIAKECATLQESFKELIDE